MKNNPLATILLVMVAILSVWSAILCYQYISKVRESHRLSDNIKVINYRQAAVTSLVNDTVEYSKKNPAIEPILHSIGVTNKAK